jgi:nucleoside-diphosphate-sugar epimerase
VKVAVLGATGFIGRALLPELGRGHDVVAVSRSGAALEGDRVKSVSGDVMDCAIVALVDRLPVMIAPTWVSMPTSRLR